jgi:hypothetical protein
MDAGAFAGQGTCGAPGRVCGSTGCASQLHDPVLHLWPQRQTSTLTRRAGAARARAACDRNHRHAPCNVQELASVLLAVRAPCGSCRRSRAARPAGSTCGPRCQHVFHCPCIMQELQTVACRAPGSIDMRAAIANMLSSSMLCAGAPVRRAASARQHRHARRDREHALGGGRGGRGGEGVELGVRQDQQRAAPRGRARARQLREVQRPAVAEPRPPLAAGHGAHPHCCSWGSVCTSRVCRGGLCDYHRPSRIGSTKTAMHGRFCLGQ